MWHLIANELRYQKTRAIGFFLGAVAVAFFFTTALDIDDRADYFLFPSLLLFAGILLHVATMWDADSEKRPSLHARMPLSRRTVAAAQIVAPMGYQLVGFVVALLAWGGLVASGVVDRATGIEATWFFVAANGAALAFLLGWAHLAPEVDAWRARSPWLAWLVAGLAVLIAMMAASWALAPRPSPLNVSYPVACSIFYPLAAALAWLKLWLYSGRDELPA